MVRCQNRSQRYGQTLIGIQLPVGGHLMANIEGALQDGFPPSPGTPFYFCPAQCSVSTERPFGRYCPHHLSLPGARFLPPSFLLPLPVPKRNGRSFHPPSSPSVAQTQVPQRTGCSTLRQRAISTIKRPIAFRSPLPGGTRKAVPPPRPVGV